MQERFIAPFYAPPRYGHYYIQDILIPYLTDMAECLEGKRMVNMLYSQFYNATSYTKLDIHIYTCTMQRNYSTYTTAKNGSFT